MAKLRLSLSLSLESHDIPFLRSKGPLFNRWLPDGRNDAILLTSDSASTQISVWFERRTKLQNEFLHWDGQGTEFNADTMVRQAKIDAGNLFGEVVVDVSDLEHSAVAQNRIELEAQYGANITEVPEYLLLAKRVVGEIQPRVGRFIDTLREQYGQYWIPRVLPWDSRYQSLGSYCAGLGLCWWDDAAGKRYRFVPNNLASTVFVTAGLRDASQDYLSEVDWRRLQSTRCMTPPPIEVQLLGQAGESLDRGHYLQAFVAATCALELAIARLVDVTEDRKSTKAAINSFFNQTMQAQIAVVLRVAKIPVDDIERILQTIKIRNLAVHEGHKITDHEAQDLRHLIKMVAKVLGLDALKSPILTGGNSLSNPPA
jgi:hypothetical protein